MTLSRPGENRLQLGTVPEMAEALRPLLGNAAFGLVGLALVASGVMAVSVMPAASAYLVAELAARQPEVGEARRGERYPDPDSVVRGLRTGAWD